ncbi:hypothetical protein EIP86_004457 [Pleurotus ostreatoroseus]|nr:hypothetical protein EIP86_004457 [Pleurotus ostreatoroseus]
MSTSLKWPSASVEARLDTEDGTVALTYASLLVEDIISSVRDDRAGATAVFVGTTRNSFKGKVVTRLDYQAYSRLAIKTMSSILDDARQHICRSAHSPAGEAVPTLIKCAIHHRLGTVPVGEPSIVIAVSSPHRKESFLACEYILEQVKLKAQIWKREFYEGAGEDEAEWKANYA